MEEKHRVPACVCVQRKEAHRKMHNDNDAEQRRMQRSRLRLPAKPLVSQPRRLMSLAKDAHAPKPPRPHALLRLLRLQEEKEEKRRGRRGRQGTLVLLAYYFACAVVVVIVIVLAITSIFGTLANNITCPPPRLLALPLSLAPWSCTDFMPASCSFLLIRFLAVDQLAWTTLSVAI